MGSLECRGGNETPALLMMMGCFPSKEFQLSDSRALVRMEESVGHSISENGFSPLGVILSTSRGQSWEWGIPALAQKHLCTRGAWSESVVLQPHRLR